MLEYRNIWIPFFHDFQVASTFFARERILESKNSLLLSFLWIVEFISIQVEIDPPMIHPLLLVLAAVEIPLWLGQTEL